MWLIELCRRQWPSSTFKVISVINGFDVCISNIKRIVEVSYSGRMSWAISTVGLVFDRKDLYNTERDLLALAKFLIGPTYYFRQILNTF